MYRSPHLARRCWRHWIIGCAVIFLLVIPASVRSESPVTFRKIVLTDDFFAEGAGIADVNQDGHGDAIYGPHWYAGPDLKTEAVFLECLAPDGSTNSISISLPAQEE